MIVEKISFVRLCAIAIFSLGSFGVYADEHVKNGMPCLSGVCVGDDISILKNINWEPAVSQMGKPLESITPDILGKDRMAEVAKIFPLQIDKQELAAIAPYIYLKK